MTFLTRVSRARSDILMFQNIWKRDIPIIRILLQLSQSGVDTLSLNQLIKKTNGRVQMGTLVWLHKRRVIFYNEKKRLVFLKCQTKEDVLQRIRNSFVYENTPTRAESVTKSGKEFYTIHRPESAEWLEKFLEMIKVIL